MLTSLRKSVLANYSRIFHDDKKFSIRRTSKGIVSVNQDSKMYERVKELVIKQSTRYSEKMAKEVARNLGVEAVVLKKKLNGLLTELMNDIIKDIM